MKKGKKVIIIIISVLMAVILTLVAAFYILALTGKLQFHKDDTHISTDAIDIEDDNTIIHNGKKYVLNKDIVSVLVIGIDKSNMYDDFGYGKNGHADTIFVAAINTSTKKIKMIPISRETMVDVNVYTTQGAYAGVEYEQLCLAYAYGDTPESCSENVMTSVRRILYGININSYVTVNLTGIERFTEMLGGIELTSIDTLPLSNKTVTPGERLILSGVNARRYIQYRDSDLEANNRRMARQKQFLSALVTTAGNKVMSDFTRLGSYYNTLSPYFSTNVSLSQVTYLASTCLTLNLGDLIEYKNIEGTVSKGEKWTEFVPDSESVLNTVIDTFYVEK